MRYFILALSSVFLASGCGCSGKTPPPAILEPQKANTNENENRKFALLVGCTTYDELPRQDHLKGPANDVVLMRKVLTECYDFADKNIITLAEGPTSAGRPTRANIKKQFDRFANEARDGDQVVILLSGHGSQQPDQEPYDEIDGLDETFLPCDAGRWDALKEMVVNAIVDDELGTWSKVITDRGASVWLILDSCHSGTMLRGDDEDIMPRRIRGTLVPDEALRKARQRAMARRVEIRNADDPFHVRMKPVEKTQRLVALYSCQPHEETYELALPPRASSRTYHGLLTYTVCQILMQARTPLTYRELRERVHAQYLQWKMNFSIPTPGIEGPNQSTEVLGQRSRPARSPLILSGNGKGLKVGAGSLHGLTEGSILAVFPPAGNEKADKPVGHVRVGTVTIAESEVEPCSHEKMSAPKELPQDGRCELVALNFGSIKLKVAIEKAEKAETEVHRRWRQTLSEMAIAPDSVIDLVENGNPDLWVRIKEDNAYLLGADVVQTSNARQRGGTIFGPYAIGKIDEITAALLRIVKARNLVRTVSGCCMDRPANLEIKLLKMKDQNDKVGTEVVLGARGAELHPGEWFALDVANKGQTPLDVTLLIVNSQYGITSFPRSDKALDGDNRLYPGQPPHRLGPGPTPDNMFGLEHVIAIAAPGVGVPIDFTALAQPTLELATARTRSAEALNSPLGQLLKSAMFGRGTRNVLPVVPSEDQVTLRLLSWSVIPPLAVKKE